MIVTLLRTVILYVVVIIGLRIMGKRQIADMQPNELVTTILISDLATIPIQDIKQPALNGIIAIIILVCVEVALSFVTLKSDRLRRIIDGKPVIVVRHGEIDQAAMRSLRLTVDDLLGNLRENQVFELAQVEYAIVETNGKMSVLLTQAAQPITASQAQIKTENKGLSAPVVCDGKLRDEFMEAVGITPKRVEKLLKKKGAKMGDVFLMTVDAAGKAVLVKKEEQQ